MSIIVKEKSFNADSTGFFESLPKEAKERAVYQRLSIGDIEFIEMYCDDGKAKPLMFVIHGGGGKKENELGWVNKYSREGFYAITLDVAAHGENNRGPMLNMEAWLETVGYIDTLIEYAHTQKQANATCFSVAGSSMGGVITFLYGAKGKYTPSILLPELGAVDFTEVLNGRANSIINHSDWMGTAEITDELIKKAQELSPLNYIDRFINIPMYARFGGMDYECGIKGVRLFISKLKKISSVIQILNILEGYGHGGFPDDYYARMSYIMSNIEMN